MSSTELIRASEGRLLSQCWSPTSLTTARQLEMTVVVVTVIVAVVTVVATVEAMVAAHKQKLCQIASQSPQRETEESITLVIVFALWSPGLLALVRQESGGEVLACVWPEVAEQLFLAVVVARVGHLHCL